MAQVAYEGEVPVLKERTTICYWMENDGMVEEQECVVHEMGPAEYYLLERQVGIPKQRCHLGHTYGQMGRIG